MKLLPTATERARFRKYARRMRELRDNGISKTLYSNVYYGLRLRADDEPLFPNLKALDLWRIREPLIPLIPLFLPPTITSVSLGGLAYDLDESEVLSAVEGFLRPFPNVQDIALHQLPRHPVITAAASKMFFVSNRNALRRFHVDSPLTEEATEAICKLKNLCSLSMIIEKGTPIPSALLPNLTHLQLKCDDGSDGLQLLRRATFGKLKSINFHAESGPIDDFLEALKGAPLSSSIQNTFSVIRLSAKQSWDPNYSSFLPFTQLVDLSIEPSCDDGCSRVDDDVVISLSRAMPKLKSLQLGDLPCRRFTGGVTAKGLVALARNCPNLSSLCVHFQAVSLSDPPAGLETTHNAGYSVSWTGCALTKLEVGKILVPEGSASIIALTLLRIFPRIETIGSINGTWREVENMIRRSKQIFDCSSKYRHLTVPRNSWLTLLRCWSYGQ